MDDKPLVSVLINNYNYGRFLAEAIDSALAQTYPHVEVIVVDDGSTDDSRAIIAAYGDRIIPVLKENGGHASAFNAGFAVSRGELVCFLDSDDLWLPKKVTEMVTAVGANPEANLVYHQMRFADEHARPTKNVTPLSVLHGNIRHVVAHSGGWWQFPPTSGLSFRRGFLERVLPVPETRYRRFADPYLADLVPFFGPVHGVQTPLALYRQHQTNHSTTQTVRSRLQIYETRVDGLNDALARFGFTERVRLEDHWPYQRLTYLSGSDRRFSLLALTRLRLRDPSEPRVWIRLRSTVGLWLNSALRLGSAARGRRRSGQRDGN